MGAPFTLYNEPQKQQNTRTDPSTLSSIMNALTERICLKCVLVSAVLLLFGSLLAAKLSAQRAKDVNPTNAELYRDILLLMDLDAGNLKSARQKLNEDSMFCVLFIMESVAFTTNKDVLYSQPGLRAAAKYWGNKSLPTDMVYFQMNDPSLSNRIYNTIKIVRTELDRTRRQ